MISRPVAVALLATGCLTAAVGGAYLSVRQTSAAVPAVVAPAAPSAVTETETVVTPSAAPAPAPATVPEPAVETPVAPVAAPEPPRRAPARPAAVPAAQPRPRSGDTQPRDTVVPAAPSHVPAAEPATPPVVAASEPVAPRPAPPVEEAPVTPPPPPAPRMEEIVVPAASVVGLEVETTVTSDTARLEDRVDARVARDVYADGRLVIPAGSRVVGAVSAVERGGKVKERARLGIRFHTLVLADGRQMDIRTDTIFREGESPANGSSKKIGGAAVGGAVLGAIMGGKKGAVIGGIAGAGAGTAAVMAGDRQHATLPVGTVLNVRLASPLTIDVERR